MSPPTEPIAGQESLKTHDPRLTALLAYWRGIRGDDVIPRKQRFDPVAIPELLPYIYLWSYDERSNEFLFRLAGEHILAMFGREPKPGMTMADCMPASFVETIRRRYLRIVEERVLMYDRGTVRTSEGKEVSSERIILPLSDDGIAVTHLVGATIYGDATVGTFITEDSEELVFAIV